jgi:hypothetical protein
MDDDGGVARCAAERRAAIASRQTRRSSLVGHQCRSSRIAALDYDHDRETYTQSKSKFIRRVLDDRSTEGTVG